jgi:hypothetical protein
LLGSRWASERFSIAKSKPGTMQRHEVNNLFEKFRRKFLKSLAGSAVIARNKPEAWRKSVPHDQVVVSKTGELCRDVVRE